MEKFLEEVDWQFCLSRGCDANYTKLRELCKGSRQKPCKRLTFTDCQRKNPEELKEYREYRKRYREERFGQYRRNQSGTGGFGAKGVVRDKDQTELGSEFGGFLGYEKKASSRHGSRSKAKAAGKMEDGFDYSNYARMGETAKRKRVS